VTSNLDVALRYLRLKDQPRVLWIDAICINQHNIQERNKQVAQMRSIYQSARRVCIWPGEDDTLESRGMDFIDQIYDYFPGV
jgi:hypothetical protein